MPSLTISSTTPSTGICLGSFARSSHTHVSISILNMKFNPIYQKWPIARTLIAASDPGLPAPVNSRSGGDSHSLTRRELVVNRGTPRVLGGSVGSGPWPRTMRRHRLPAHRTWLAVTIPNLTDEPIHVSFAYVLTIAAALTRRMTSGFLRDYSAGKLYRVCYNLGTHFGPPSRDPLSHIFRIGEIALAPQFGFQKVPARSGSVFVLK